MNKTELIAAVAEKTGMSKKDTEAVIAATLGTITAALHEEEKVQLMGFGSFEVKKRAARTGRNPRSKETIEIPASQTPVFKAGKALKDAVAKKKNRPFRRRGVFPRRRVCRRRFLCWSGRIGTRKNSSCGVIARSEATWARHQPSSLPNARSACVRLQSVPYAFDRARGTDSHVGPMGLLGMTWQENRR